MAKLPNNSFEKGLLDGLEKTLAELPGVKLSRNHSLKQNDEGADAVLSIRVQGRLISVLVQAKQSGFPRDVRNYAIHPRNIIKERRGVEAVSIIAAPSISTGGRNLLRQQGIGYFDGGGSLYLPLSNGLYFIDRQPPSGDRRLRSIYKGRSSQVIHLLLARHDRKWHINEMAEEAQVSPYTVHQVFTSLEKQLWIERQGKGPDSVRTLREPAALLDAWSENYSMKQFEFRNYYRWSQSLESLRKGVAEKIEKQGGEYALTLSSGAALVAPFTTNVDRLHFIVPSGLRLEDVVQAAGLKPVEDGANVIFMISREHSPLLLRRRLKGVWVASDVQIYLDLRNWPARGKEQAAHLRKERLSY